MERIGFKEWALVCEALGRDEQSILLRKGGLAEGRDGFAFRHPEFFLFPTFFHEQVEQTRLTEAELPVPDESRVEIRVYARIEAKIVVKRWETASALAPLHVLREEVVRERFAYEGRHELHVALVRVFRVEPAWILPNERSFGGCRSWIGLPPVPPGMDLIPVLGDAEQKRRAEQFQEVIRVSDTLKR